MKQAWIWFLGLLLGLSFTIGCDAPYAATYIDTFTCAYLPWYFADCTSTEVHDKAVAILHDGVVQASVECDGAYEFQEGTSSGFCFNSIYWPNTTTVNYHYKAQKMLDGSCFMDWKASGHNATSLGEASAPAVAEIGFTPRSDPETPRCGLLFEPKVHVEAHAGYLTIHPDTTSNRWVSSGCPETFTTPDTVVDLSTCKGFNKDQF